jgi:uncharacterized secreted protein with C-terminal beta-propeller domain
MTRRPTTVFIVLASMLLAGCLGAVDEWIEDGENHPVMDWIAPELNLGYRVRSSPVLDTYDNCGALEEDLRNSLAEEMLVSLDQASYWHWDSWGWRGGGMVDDMVMEMDGGAPVADQSTSGGAEASGSANSGSDSSAPPSSSGAGDREGQYSETNNQEEGVDEADFLKTDGYHIYMINNGQLVILGVPEFGEIELESNITLEGSPMQMLLADDQLVIISYVSYWNLEEDDPIRQAMLVDGGNSGGSGASGLTADAGMPYYRYTNMVKFTVIDVSNRSAPEINRELFLDGSYQTSRLVGNSLRAVSHSYAEIYGLQTYPVLPANYYQIDYDNPQRQNIWNQSVNSTIETNLEIISGLTLSDFVPRMHERLADGSVTELSTVSATCEEFAAATDSVGRGFTTIMTIELFGNDIEYELDHISSSWVEVYASQDMLVLAEPANDWWWYWRNTDYEEATNIHAFDISEVGLTTYIGSGRVTGSVNDQFSLSEFNGTIRVATTTDNSWGRWWFEDGEEWTGPTNDVHVLAPGEQGGEELLTIGHIGDIAEGERIWSCRFIGEKGYLVTFRNVDPLWTIDLSNPSDPQVIGELEVPGVSTYIHPLGDDHLLTIGMAGGEGGIGLDWGNTQISMFDVSDFANPNLAAAQQLSPVDEGGEDGWGWNWAYSEASYEHKAFTYWGPAELLAIPLSTYRYTYDEVVIDGKTYTHYGYEYVSQLILLDVDVENETLSIYGTIDHSNFYNGESGIREYYYSGNTNIRRSIFMGDYVYAFSSEGVTVTNYSSMALSDSLQLPEMVQPDYYYTEYYYEDDAVDAEGEETSGSSGESEPDEPAEESTDDD